MQADIKGAHKNKPNSYMYTHFNTGKFRLMGFKAHCFEDFSNCSLTILKSYIHLLIECCCQA